MSVDEIRRKAREAQAIPQDDRRFTPDGKVHLDPDPAEALCDLADAARRWSSADVLEDTLEAHAAMRAALARLDGEDTG